MFSADKQKYRCPSGNPSTAVCVDPKCQSACFICGGGCEICNANHVGHTSSIPIDTFMMRALQRPNVDPILLDTYDRLMELLETDPSLENMCDELPDWFTEQLNSQFETNQLRKCLISGQISNHKWFTGKSMMDLLR